MLASRLLLAVGVCGLVAPGAAWSSATTAHAGDLSETIKRVKPAVVAVGTYQALRRPPARLLGTGFAVADGRHVVTSAHVLPDKLDEQRKESIAVFVGARGGAAVRTARVAGIDEDHDVAVLRISGPPVPTLRLGDDTWVEEGKGIAFTGFPIGPVLGLHPSTHRGIVSAIAPVSLPQVSPRQLDSRMIKQLREGFPVFQLDATAYPGNSGSPLYDVETGVVYGIVNSVFVKETKERVLQDPSGIAYAVPVRYAKALLKKIGLPD
ncbi:MAG: serine protease [Kiloniellaceae bacterium]